MPEQEETPETGALTDGRKTLVIVEDDPEHAEALREEMEEHKINGNNVNIHVHIDFRGEELDSLLDQADYLVLDLYEGDPKQGGEEHGSDVLKRLKERALCPIVIYSAFADTSKDATEESLFVRRVRKSEGAEEARKALEELDASGATDLYHAVVDHVEGVARRYVWNYLDSHIERVPDGPDKADVVRLLVQRIGLDIVSEKTLHQLFNGLGLDDGVDDGKVHPSSIYLIPPLYDDYVVGDILKEEETGDHYVVVQPSCDLTTRDGKKPDNRCVLVCKADEFNKDHGKWQANAQAQRDFMQEATGDTNPRDSPIGRIMANADGLRRHFLPGFHKVPNLLVNFSKPRVEEYRAITSEGWTRIATLSPPFAEHLSSRFSSFVGRIGVPDLDIRYMLQSTSEEEE